MSSHQFNINPRKREAWTDFAQHCSHRLLQQRIVQRIIQKIIGQTLIHHEASCHFWIQMDEWTHEDKTGKNILEDEIKLSYLSSYP